MNDPRFEVFPERKRAAVTAPLKPGDAPSYLTGEFVWHFKDANGRITFTGGESFTRREDAHRSIKGAAYDIVRLVVRPAHGLDLVLPIVDLDQNGDVIPAESSSKG